jgi:hypothetical protein
VKVAVFYQLLVGKKKLTVFSRKVLALNRDLGRTFTLWSSHQKLAGQQATA